MKLQLTCIHKNTKCGTGIVAHHMELIWNKLKRGGMSSTLIYASVRPATYIRAGLPAPVSGVTWSRDQSDCWATPLEESVEPVARRSPLTERSVDKLTVALFLHLALFCQM